MKIVISCKSYGELLKCLKPGLGGKGQTDLVLFIYLLLAVLGLRCCVRAFSSCRERGLLFVAVRGLLIEVASLVVEHGL